MSSKPCPHCQTPNRPSARFCANCGQSLAADQTVAPSANCPHCQAPVPQKAPLCPICGYPLQGRPAVTGKMELAGLPTLVVRWPGGQTEKHELSPEAIYIGRVPGNDIVLSFPTVSARHLRLDVTPGEILVTDLNSTNGTQLNGQQIPPSVPQPWQLGDVIRVGDLRGNSVSMILEGSAGERWQTRPLGMHELAHLSQALIGRDPSSQFHLNHPTVSWRHAEIVRHSGGFAIRDLDSSNGTFVNGQRVTEQVTLDFGDAIQIGPFKLVYDGQVQGLTTLMSRGHRLDAIELGMQVAEGRMILEEISLSVQMGEFAALVGGSGAGKSTLLKAMNGYNPATHGKMLIDGQDLYSNLDAYRMLMGYVPQDDIIHRELPVRLALWYAAKLRLPDASEGEIERRIQDVLAVVEMTEHVDKPVRVLSGGQRKRVSIAVELLAQPDLLFLDEPTSGLDPGLEKKMMYDLNRLADQGRTVVLVTHATANIEQCDHVAFLVQGHLAYYGPPDEAISFFQAQDFADIYLKLSQEVNPAEEKPPPPELQPYYEAVRARLSSLEGRQKGNGQTFHMPAGLLWAEHYRQSPFYQEYVASRQPHVTPADRTSRVVPSRQLERAPGSALRQVVSLVRCPFDLIQGTRLYQKYVARRQPSIAPAGSVLPGASGKQPKRARDSTLRQIGILARRQFDLIRHDVRTLFILLLMMPVIALLFMMVSDKEDLTGKQLTPAQIEAELEAELEGAKMGEKVDYMPEPTATQLITMLGLAITQAGTFGAAYEIVKERAIFKRERAINLRVAAYILAKVLVLSSFAVIQVASVLLVLGLKVDLGFDPAFDIFPIGALELFVTLLFAVLASIMLGLFISAVVPSADVVLYVILIQLFVQIILSGTLFPLPDNPASKLVISQWTMNAIGSTVDLQKLNEESLVCQVVPVAGAEKVICESAARDAEDLGLDYEHSTEHVLSCWGALLAQAIVWGGATTLVQARKKTE